MRKLSNLITVQCLEIEFDLSSGKVKSNISINMTNPRRIRTFIRTDELLKVEMDLPMKNNKS